MGFIRDWWDEKTDDQKVEIVIFSSLAAMGIGGFVLGTVHGKRVANAKHAAEEAKFADRMLDVYLNNTNQGFKYNALPGGGVHLEMIASKPDGSDTVGATFMNTTVESLEKAFANIIADVKKGE